MVRTEILEDSPLKWIPSKDMLIKLQMTSPGSLRAFGDTGVGEVREEESLKIDSVLPIGWKKWICILKDWKTRA